MVNQHNQVVCDITKVILEDGICIYPGYVSIKNGRLYRHFSDDPNNTIPPFLTDDKGRSKGANPEYKIGMLKNRKEFERVVDEGDAPAGVEEGHFIDLDTLYRALEIRKHFQETGEVMPDPDAPSGAVAPDLASEPEVEVRVHEPEPSVAEEVAEAAAVPVESVLEETPSTEEVPTPAAPLATDGINRTPAEWAALEAARNAEANGTPSETPTPPSEGDTTSPVETPEAPDVQEQVDAPEPTQETEEKIAEWNDESEARYNTLVRANSLSPEESEEFFKLSKLRPA